jgi:hypothetical protein
MCLVTKQMKEPSSINLIFWGGIAGAFLLVVGSLIFVEYQWGWKWGAVAATAELSIILFVIKKKRFATITAIGAVLGLAVLGLNAIMENISAYFHQGHDVKKSDSASTDNRSKKSSTVKRDTTAPSATPAVKYAAKDSWTGATQQVRAGNNNAENVQG